MTWTVRLADECKAYFQFDSNLYSWHSIAEASKKTSTWRSAGTPVPALPVAQQVRHFIPSYSSTTFITAALARSSAFTAARSVASSSRCFCRSPMSSWTPGHKGGKAHFVAVKLSHAFVGSMQQHLALCHQVRTFRQHALKDVLRNGNATSFNYAVPGSHYGWASNQLDSVVVDLGVSTRIRRQYDRLLPYPSLQSSGYYMYLPAV